MINFQEAHQTVGNPVVTSFDLKSSAPDNLVEMEELWEFELDLIGAAATPQALQQILERAPNSESATAQYLMGFLACHDKK